MSILPQYQPISQAEPWHEPANNDAAWQKAPAAAEHDVPAYPPRADAERDAAPVTYIFVPAYPVKGKQESVLGIMGRDKDETTAMVQRAFPLLDAYPADRVVFSTPVDDSSKPSDSNWSRILEEAWPRFRANPPARLKVTVADGPGDAALRKRRNCIVGWAFFLLILSPLWLSVLITLAIFAIQ